MAEPHTSIHATLAGELHLMGEPPPPNPATGHLYCTLW